MEDLEEMQELESIEEMDEIDEIEDVEEENVKEVSKPQAKKTSEEKCVSKFTGGLLGLIGVNFVTFLVSSITLFIAYPWMVCFKQKWIAKHTIIDGKQMTFDGTGGQLFGNYIKWLLLSFITFGIYTLWLGIKMTKWTTKHTHFE